MSLEHLPLSAITLDVELQPRDEIDQDLLGHYIALLMDGVELPPVLAFQNGDDSILLADGFHRYYAHKGVGAETIAVDLQHGDRREAIRASLQANATHGQPRNPATLQRAYGLAIKHELVDPADANAVVAVLGCSMRTAHQLTEEARDDRRKALRSIAYQLHARGLTQRQIAEKLGVAHNTVGGWLVKFGEAPELTTAPALPDQATLDRIAQAIKEQAKGEVREEVEAQVRDEIGDRQGQRTDFTLAAIRDRMGCVACKNCEWMKEQYVCTALCTPVGGPDCDIADEMLCAGEAWEWDGTTLPEDDDDEGEPLADLPEVKPKQTTRDVAAKAAGFSSTTSYRQAKSVVAAGGVNFHDHPGGHSVAPVPLPSGRPLASARPSKSAASRSAWCGVSSALPARPASP